MSGGWSGRTNPFWFWSGESEFFGELLSWGVGRLTARVRRAGRWTPSTGAPGTPVPMNLRERQRWISRRVGFGQSPGIHFGALLEFHVSAIQPTWDPEFEVILGGAFWRIADEHLEPLSDLGSFDALDYLQTHSSYRRMIERMKIG